MKLVTISIIISAVAATLGVLHIIFPAIGIDTVTLALFIVAILPWIIPLLKSVELPGDITIEFRDLEKIKEKAEEIGLLSPPEKRKAEPTYAALAKEDPNLALAGLRIEIERRLGMIAKAKGIEEERKGIGHLLRVLSENNAISREEYSVLSDMVGVLNRAVHGADVEPKVAEWAIDVGTRMIAALDERLHKET